MTFPAARHGERIGRHTLWLAVPGHLLLACISGFGVPCRYRHDCAEVKTVPCLRAGDGRGMAGNCVLRTLLLFLFRDDRRFSIFSSLPVELGGRPVYE